MSQRLISRSRDLKRLRDEGYDVTVKAGHLLVKGVPYVNAQKEVKRGALVSVLDLSADDTTVRPATHVLMFAGETPCHRDGQPLNEMIIASERRPVAQDLTIDHQFSSKPPRGHYVDYFEKMTTYVAILSSPARSIDPNVTAQTYPAIEEDPGESVFEYTDTASSRAGISAVSQKLEAAKVAIVGLGGTGSYVLDQVAKTPVREIHLFDGDKFSPHNAFRSPGAASVADLRTGPSKVEYFRTIYSRMHRHIVPHAEFLGATNVDALRGMTFVFLCLDKSGPKKAVVGKLEELGIPFIDVGMGVYLKDSSLYGVLRVTTSTPDARSHVHDRGRIPLAEVDVADEYATNIQVAELNALNAALAVVKWKKLCGFYGDFEHEHFCTYTIDGNVVTNEDR